MYAETYTNIVVYVETPFHETQIMFIIPKLREPDDFGAGYFGASRGKRKHNGIDPAAEPGAIVGSIVAGVITKIGYPYGDDLSYRYVEVTTPSGDRVRYFYVVPTDDCGTFEIGTEIEKCDPLGVVQDIAARYDTDDKKMNNHFHLEIKRNGEYLNPTDWLSEQS